jgi:hypothetical protein
VNQSVKIQLDQGDKTGVKTGRGVRQEYFLSLILFKVYNEYLTKEVLEGYGDFKIVQIICTVNYTDLVLLAQEETVH